MMIKSAAVTIGCVRMKCRGIHVYVKMDIVEIIVKVRTNFRYSCANNHKNVID